MNGAVELPAGNSAKSTFGKCLEVNDLSDGAKIAICIKNI
jgi:hypothetical protein